MIETISELLNGLKQKEQELLEKYSIVKHPGIIGDMYEGLTKDLLNKSVFKNLNLNITSGKIRNSKGEFSDEIDCMITIGVGDKIPYTDKEIVDSNKVIAVIQVKKNLYSKDLADSYQNLKSVLDVMDLTEFEDYHYRILKSAWRIICREELPKLDQSQNLSYDKQILLHVLKMEAFYPARIVWGYNGFKSEFKLRESYIEFLEKGISANQNIGGLGPNQFPSLIICNKYSIFKNNGIPFSYPLIEENYWLLYASTYENPFYYLLEIIWTRLHFKFKLHPEIFGDDLRMEEMHGFLLAKFMNTDEMKGWVYEYVPATKMELEKKLEHKEWTPFFLNDQQYMIISLLCLHGKLDFNKDTKESNYLIENGYTVDGFCDELKSSGLVSYIGGILTLITDKCVVGMDDTGRYFAGDNATGRLSKWLDKQKKNSI